MTTTYTPSPVRSASIELIDDDDNPEASIFANADARIADNVEALRQSVGEDVGLLNWRREWYSRIDPLTITDTALIALSYGGATQIRAFYWDTYGAWVSGGVDSNGQFYIGADPLVRKDTGAAFKYAFGCETSAGRMFLGSTADTGASDPVATKTTNVGSIAAWSNVTFAAGGAHTNAATNAATLLSDDTILFVGGVDTKRCVWQSTDGGATFTRIDVATEGSFPGFRGVREGKSGRVFAWPTLAGAAGDKMYYSDDSGATWTAITALGKDTIYDVVYVAAFDVYLVLASGFVARVPAANITAGAYTWSAFAGTSMATDGRNVVYLTASQIFLSWDGLLSTREVARVTNPLSICFGYNQFVALCADEVLFSQRQAVRP